MARTRKTIEDWLTEDNKRKIHDWIRAGCTREQVAKNMGINRATFYRWTEQNETFASLVKMCDDALVEEIEGCLYKCCREGNVAAIIFALKNKSKDRWKDKVESETRVEIEDTSSLSMMLKLDGDDEDAGE